MWWDRGDWGGLGTWSVGIAVTGYPPGETLRWWVQNVRAGLGKRREIVWGGDLAWSGDGMGAWLGVIARIIIRGMMLIVSVTITP